MPEKTLLFTILYNRFEMFRLQSVNVLTHARNARYVLWDNGTDPRISKYCKTLIHENFNPSVEIIYHKSDNIGLNAAAEVVNRYVSDCKYIMSIDEDILYMPMNFQKTLQKILRQTEMKLGYVACNVFQDILTNGAMPPLDKYKLSMVDGEQILIGPTGGWATMTDIESYKKVGGFPKRPELFFGLDGLYRAALQGIGIESAIAKNCTVYHATGPTWNGYFTYDTVYKLKMDHFRKSGT